MNKLPILCRSIAVPGLANIKQRLEGAQLAEVRLEKSGLTLKEIEQLFSSQPNLIATCRPEGYNDTERMQYLKTAIKHGAAWVDIEIESNDDYMHEMVSFAHKHDCKVIISYHNYENTPSRETLHNIFNSCIENGADLVKLACLINSKSDIINMLDMYQNPHPVLAIGMGELGTITRIAGHSLGAPFTFVSIDNEEATAPGQITEENMQTILNLL